jgi:hypothetical protein
MRFWAIGTKKRKWRRKIGSKEPWVRLKSAQDIKILMAQNKTHLSGKLVIQSKPVQTATGITLMLQILRYK